MSKITIDSSQDLDRFLKILAEESVSKARININEDDEQSYYEKQIPVDKRRFKAASMHEQEEVEDAEGEAEEAAPSEAQPQKAKSDKPVEDITFFKIRDELNTIRSGKSLKDKELRAELEQYVDRLEGDEKRVLHTFLTAIGNIMTDVVSGTDAKDPSDPPTSLKVSKEKQAKTTDDETDDQVPEDEDTTPPIKVGVQQTEHLRQKIQKLMLS
tara:strand:+ start:1038 stop:1676 length:639 start_codon:yes stop_codon:yes gene_type:complete